MRRGEWEGGGGVHCGEKSGWGELGVAGTVLARHLLILANSSYVHERCNVLVPSMYFNRI